MSRVPKKEVKEEVISGRMRSQTLIHVCFGVAGSQKKALAPPGGDLLMASSQSQTWIQPSPYNITCIYR